VLALVREGPSGAAISGPGHRLHATPTAHAAHAAHAVPPFPLRTPALRQLETPERAEVRTADGDATSPPLAIRWREQVIAVAHAVGPERLAGDWWGATYARDYWRCEDAAGTGHLVLYRDCTTSPPAWYVHAWYD
jgi:protein ImuB